MALVKVTFTLDQPTVGLFEEAAERLLIPMPVRYKWLRGPRRSEELAAQEPRSAKWRKPLKRSLLPAWLSRS